MSNDAERRVQQWGAELALDKTTREIERVVQNYLKTDDLRLQPDFDEYVTITQSNILELFNGLTESTVKKLLDQVLGDQPVPKGCADFDKFMATRFANIDPRLNFQVKVKTHLTRAALTLVHIEKTCRNDVPMMHHPASYAQLVGSTYYLVAAKELSRTLSPNAPQTLNDDHWFTP